MSVQSDSHTHGCSTPPHRTSYVFKSISGETILLGCLYKTLVVSMSDPGCAAIEETRDIDQAPNLLGDDIA